MHLGQPPPHWGADMNGCWVILAWHLLRNTTWIADPLPRRSSPFEVAVLPNHLVDISRLPNHSFNEINRSLASSVYSDGHILIATDGSYKEEDDLTLSGYLIISDHTLPSLCAFVEGRGGGSYVGENLALQRAISFLTHAFLPAH